MSAHYLDHKIFYLASVSEEASRMNAEIVKMLSAMPDQWAVAPEEVRKRRRQGKGPFPLAPRSVRARDIAIEGRGGEIALRIIAPETPEGVYLHFHGGGWTLGAPDEQDPRLERLADNSNLACISVDYRLAPEHPFPAGPDDCETAALWLVDQCENLFGTKRLMIGGESAGAHLSVLTLLRLRDRHKIEPFSGANLVAGCYDLTLTPSARNWGDEKLILNTRDITNFADCFVPRHLDKSSPEISPIHANLESMPPALFSTGTRDPLLDDSLFMSARWIAAGNSAELEVYSGGAHVFMAFPGSMGEKALARIETFLKTC